MTPVRRESFAGRPGLAPAVSDALAGLAKIAQEKPSLRTSCEVLREIVPVLFGEPVSASPPVLDDALAHEKLAAGLPLLRGEAVRVEAKALRGRWLAVCAAAGRQHTGAGALDDAFDDLDPAALLGEVLAGRPEAIRLRTDAVDVDAALAATVFRVVMFPELIQVAAALEPLRRQSPWDHGMCPICGSWPLLGESRGLEQSRWLRCGLCACDWQWSRLRCPFCDNRDHRLLGYLQIEGEETRHRVATCDACRGYVKMMYTLSALSAPHLLVADLATVHLDLVAADRGFLMPG
jgi:FdhE protein